MTSADILADLRLADRSLRRYATNMTGGPVDGLLHTAYVSTVRWQEPVLDGRRAALSLFRRVHTAVIDVTPIDEANEADAVGAALRSVPLANRGALLLTALEGLRPEEASQVIGLNEAAVVDFAEAGAILLRRQIPRLENADLTQIGGALADLPVVQAPVQFWEGVEREIGSIEPEPPPVDETLIIEPTLTRTTPPPPEESVWPAVWAGIGAVAVVALIVVFLVSRSGNEVAAGDLSSTSTIPAPTTSLGGPATTTPSSTPAQPTTSSSLPDQQSTTVAPPTQPPTTQPPPGSGPPSELPRGDLPLEDGLAIIAGTVNPGQSDVWQVEVPAGATLSIASSGSGDTTISLSRSDNSSVSADYADSGLIVFTEPGRHVLRFSNGGGSALTYSVGVGVTGPQSGFLTNLDERGAAVSSLELVTCSASSNQLTATLTTGNGSDVFVMYTGSADPSTITWQGSEQANGTIESTFPVTTGLVLTGTITGGRDGVIGLPFWLGIYGCGAS